VVSMGFAPGMGSGGTVTSVRNLGIFIDSDLVIHVQRTVSECFAVLRQLRLIRNSFGADGHVPVTGGRSGAIQI